MNNITDGVRVVIEGYDGSDRVEILIDPDGKTRVITPQGAFRAEPIDAACIVSHVMSTLHALEIAAERKKAS